MIPRLIKILDFVFDRLRPRLFGISSQLFFLVKYKEQYGRVYVVSLPPVITMHASPFFRNPETKQSQGRRRREARQALARRLISEACSMIC